MRMSRLTIPSIVLLLTTSTVGCQPLCDEPEMTIPTRDVVVAAQAIEQGTSIELEMLTQRSVPIDESSSMAFESPTSAFGKVAAVDIPQFQMITPNLLIDE